MSQIDHYDRRMSDHLDPLHRRALTLLSVAAFSSAVSTRLCDPMLPDLAKAFDATPASAAHVVSAFTVAYGLLQALYGPLGDRMGKYRLIAWTTLLSTIGTVLAALAPTLDVLVAARLMTGATAAAIIPLSMAWIGDTVAYEHRQATLARFLGGQILGVIGGQFIGGLFADTLGWRWAFATLAVTYLVIGTSVWRESQANPHTHHDASQRSVGTGLLQQARTVWAEPWARVILTVVFLEGVLIFGGLAFVPTYLHQRFHISLTLAGALMSAFGLGGLSYILLARHFLRHLGEIGLAAVGGLLLLGAWLTLAFIPDWGWALLATYLAGLGFYKLHNTLQTNATQMAPAVRGMAVSLFASSYFLGQSVGVASAAQILGAWGDQALFLGIAALTPVLSTAFALLLSRRQRARPA